jgi:hypothetical protein
MSRVIGSAALGPGAVGLVGCLAGLIGIRAVRPSFLRSSVEMLDAAGRGPGLVEEKTSRAEELPKAIRGVVDPVTGRILSLAGKGELTPDDDKEPGRIEEALARRLGQVDAIAELAETAVALLNRTPLLTRSLRLPASRGAAGRAPAETSQDSSKALSRLEKALEGARENLARFRKDKQARKEAVAAVVRLAREADGELKLLESKFERVGRKAAGLGKEVAELRAAVPAWTNGAAVIGSVVLEWMGPGQLALSRWRWGRVRAARARS